MGVLVIHVLVFTVFCIVCTVFFVLFLLCVVCTSVKDYCHRLKTQLQLVLIIIIIIITTNSVTASGGDKGTPPSESVLYSPNTAKHLRGRLHF